ncbi:MAG: CIA30 family protein [Flammeovirgaceae bacterium]
MKLAVLLFLSVCMMGIGSHSQVDFGSKKDGQNWYIINDGVMGGLSRGNVDFKKNSLQFSGSVSLENNGGFTSFKSPFQSFDLSDYQTITIRMRNTGIELALTLETSNRFYMPYFKHHLAASDGEWETIKIKLTDFGQYRMGYQTGRKLTQQELKSIIRIGFITDEKRAGNFAAEIDYILFE